MKTEEKIEARDHYALFRFLSDIYCPNLEFVENIRTWCERHGIPENDREKPVKILGNASCTVLVKEEISRKSVEERINGLMMRSLEMESVPHDWSEFLDTIQRKLTFLFLKEYALNLPEISGDEFRSDEWAIGEMEKLGYINISA